MAIKKKPVVMKASLDPTDRDKVISFNASVVTPAVKNKFEKLNGGTRQMVKLINGTKIKVNISLDGTKVKVIYTLDGEQLINKSFSNFDDFETDLKVMEVNNL